MTQKFVVVTEHLYWWPVEVRVPLNDPDRAGATETQVFDMQFIALPPEEASAIEEADDEGNAFEKQHALLFRVCRDWRGPVDVAGKAVLFSRETLRQALQLPWNRTGVYRSYAQSIAGGEARRKN